MTRQLPDRRFLGDLRRLLPQERVVTAAPTLAALSHDQTEMLEPGSRTGGRIPGIDRGGGRFAALRL